MKTPFSFFVDSTGKITEHARRLCAAEIAKYPDKHIHITIEEKGEYSSKSQREYYFAVIVQGFIDYFATRENPVFLDKDQMHDTLMRDVGGFSNPFVSPFTGLPDGGRISYTRLKKAQTEGFHTLCRMKAAELGFDIKEPNER